MSLTKVTYSMLAGAAVNVLDFGASPAATASVNKAAIQAAADSLATTGGTLYFPEGIYSINTYNGSETPIVLPANVWILGSGIGNTVLVSDTHNATIFSASSKNNIKMSDFSTQVGNLVTFTLCNNIIIESVYVNSYFNDSYAMGTQAIYFNGCDNTVVDNCTIVDSENSVYYGSSGATISTNGKVTNCTFVQEHAGTYWENPVHIYYFKADKMLAQGNTFKIIDPGSIIASSMSYAIYAGDGQVGDLIISDNFFSYTPGTSYGNHILLWATTKSAIIKGNTFRCNGAFFELYGIVSACENNIIEGNYFLDGNVLKIDGTTQATISNNIFNGENTVVVPIVVTNTSSASVVGNTISGSLHEGIYIESVNDSVVSSNRLIGCGSNTVASQAPIAIIVNSATNSTIVGNAIESTASLHGIYYSGAANKKLISANVISGNTDVAIKNGYTAAPVAGTWSAGDFVMNTAPASGQPAGWMCTVAGTPGTWKAMANIA